MEDSLDNSLLSIFKNGEILFSKDYSLEYLSDELLFQHSPLNKPHATNHRVLNEWIEFFNKTAINSPLFPYVYHNLLEFVRKTFHEENGFSKLPVMKVYELYQNKDYATNLYCVKLPPKEFREYFLTLMTSDYHPSKFQALLETVPTSEKYHRSSQRIYHLSELQYKSTIVETCISKVIALFQENHPTSLHCYYIALEKLRILYCNIHRIDESILHFGHFYDTEFLIQFQDCINKVDPNSLRSLFDFVSSPLNMDYQNYKILEYHV